MNRPGAVPQALRGIPSGFGGQQQHQQQQQQQQGRAVSNRLPNGKLGSNGSGWAFGAGVPLSGGGMHNPRQLGGNLNFAQSLGGSQPATPLDLSEFPQLSNNNAQQLPTVNQSSLWSSTGSRNVSALSRNQVTPLSAQPSAQDELFGSSARMPANQGSFRFANQSQSPQVPPGNIDDFPPLNRNGGGEIGQERAAGLMAGLAFSGQEGAPPASLQTSRAGNGLLNALSATSRAAEARSTTAGPRPQDSRVPGADEDMRSKATPFREDSIVSQSSLAESAGQAAENRGHLGAIGNSQSAGKAKEEQEARGPEAHDPLAGMAPIDKFGLKGLRTLMNNYPDYNALICGIDPSNLGLNLSSSDMLSTQIYSLYDDVPPRPAVPKFHIPDCYNVTNVQPIEEKIRNFNEETLMWMFYSCPGDAKQHLAAVELHNRNWRWHKKFQLWLTKDDMMAPQVLSSSHERGYYIVWDTATWSKERRELTLHYLDLDTNPTASAA